MNKEDSKIKEIFYEIWSTPTYKKQVKLIDEILTEKSVRKPLFQYVVDQYEKIETDRKDKFLYLTLKTVELEDIQLEELVKIKSLELQHQLILRSTNLKKPRDLNLKDLHPVTVNLIKLKFN